MFERCPKCSHHPLPADQSLPATCPACGVVLAKVGAAARVTPRAPSTPSLPGRRWEPALRPGASPKHLGRLTLTAVFAVWGLHLISLDHRTGEFASAFLHRPLLLFHEAGHVLFMPFGAWLAVLGGTLGQLLMPAVMAGALLLKNRDRFGAALGVWFLGVSVLDVAPYVYDALHPQLTLLGGHTGEDGPHDWVYLLSSVGLLAHAQALGGLVRLVGALIVLGATAWAAREAWHAAREQVSAS